MSACHLTSTSRPLFLKLLMRWFSKPAFSAMAARLCFRSDLGDILRERRGTAAPVLRLRLRLLLLRRGGEHRDGYGTLLGGGATIDVRDGLCSFVRFRSKNGDTDPFIHRFLAPCSALQG